MSQIVCSAIIGDPTTLHSSLKGLQKGVEDRYKDEWRIMTGESEGKSTRDQRIGESGPLRCIRPVGR